MHLFGSRYRWKAILFRFWIEKRQRQGRLRPVRGPWHARQTSGLNFKNCLLGNKSVMSNWKITPYIFFMSDHRTTSRYFSEADIFVRKLFIGFIKKISEILFLVGCRICVAKLSTLTGPTSNLFSSIVAAEDSFCWQSTQSKRRRFETSKAGTSNVKRVRYFSEL